MKTPKGGGKRKGPKPCGAKTRAGGKCRAPAMPNGRCRVHGGASLKGVDSPNWKHGRYSKYFPTGLADRYKEVRTDPELLSVHEEVAAIQTRLADLARRLSTGEAGELWMRLRRTANEFRRAGDEDEQALLLREVFRLIDRGASDEQIWAEFLNTVDRKTNTAAREWRRQIDLNSVITAEQGIVMITTIVEIVRRYVTDRKTLSKISADVGRVLGTDGQEASGTSLRIAGESRP